MSFTYQWYRGGSPIADATSNSYLLTEDDDASVITCGVTATNENGSAEAISEGVTVGLYTPVYYNEEILALDPLYYWRLGESSGATLSNELSGYGDATLVGAYTLGVAGLLTGDEDTSVQWSGGYAYTALESNALLGTGDFTALCLVSFTTTSFSCVMTVRNGGSTPILFLLTTSRISSGDISAETWAWSNANTRVRSSAKNDGLPHHVAVRYTHSTTTLDLFIDGVLIDSRVQGAGRPTTGTLDITLGNNTNHIQGFSGKQDEVALFDTALSDTEIADLADIALNG